MRKIFSLLMLFSLVISAVFASESGNYYSLSYARLSYVKGDVYVKRGKDLGYEEGAINLPLIQGDMIGTREGRTEVHFGRRNYLRIDYNTRVELVKLPTREEDITRLHLLTGNIYLLISTMEYEKSFEVHTPDASFYFFEEGLYRLDVSDGGKTELFVFRGSAEAAGEEGSILVESEQKIAATEGFFLSRPLFFSSYLNDDFSEWNRYRDSLLVAREANTYLPAELAEYEAELAANGRWVYESPYGYVWVPYVSHYTWRPYFYGRWVWYPVIGWTWVSYEPWGWSVYHYGRWHWRRGLGWYWIPMRVWGPAWVYWYWGYDYIGWCPLSYYGYPVVIINNIFYDRYYSRYYPYRSRALTVIRKSQLQVRNVSKVALRSEEIRRIGKITLTRKSLGVKPVVKRISGNPEAARVLSLERVRKISKNYISGKRVISPSELNSLDTRVPVKRISESRTKNYVSRGKSSSSGIRDSSSRLKNYSSRRSSGRSLDKRVSSKSTFPSRIKIKASHRSSSSLRNSGKGSITRYRPSSLSSGKRISGSYSRILESPRSTSGSKISSSRLRSSLKSSDSSPKSSYSLRKYLSRRYSSSSTSRSSLSRSSSSRKSSYHSSSLRRSSSKSFTSSSRRSGSSRSSSIRSSSRSSSGGKLRKKN